VQFERQRESQTHGVTINAPHGRGLLKEELQAAFLKLDNTLVFSGKYFPNFAWFC